MDDQQTTFTTFEQKILNNYQQCLSLSLTPFRDIANDLGVSESKVIKSIKSLQERGAISRVGPVFRPNRVGVSTLATMSIPEYELDTIARIISAFPEVNHNYQREHYYNLWFVVTASSTEHLDIVLHEIEQHTGHSLMSLPMLEDYFIDLGFELNLAIS